MTPERERWERHPNFHGMAATLLRIHDSFRATSSALVDIARGDDVDEARRLFGPLDRKLHLHHHAEELLLFPLVAEITGEHPRALVDDHRALMARLDAVAAALERGDEPMGPPVRALDAALRDHLAREEAVAVPALLRVTPAEAERRLRGLG